MLRTGERSSDVLPPGGKTVIGLCVPGAGAGRKYAPAALVGRFRAAAQFQD
jgi:hypothetical protein